jgi:hypothetical protein
MKPRDLNEIIPLEFQAGLPPGILYQPPEIGGSLGFSGSKPAGADFWDDLEAEAGVGVGALNIRQTLNTFLFNATPVSQLVLPFNKARVYLMLQNQGTSRAFVAFGHVATDRDFQIPTGPGFYEPILGTVSSVHMISAVGTQPITVVEGFRV